jgi:N-acetylmuramoyl-L-alanine amidase
MEINKSKKFNDFFDKILETRKIDFLVLHHIEATSVDHTIKLLKEYQVSSHFLIDEFGEIFELVDENNIAYHAGVSFWRGFEGLNKNSIGIEFINSKAFEKNFEWLQLSAGIALCKYLKEKYAIKNQNIVGHSDIAYNKETGFLDRKQDPSHLFNWNFLAQNNVGIFPQVEFLNEKPLFSFGDKDVKILEIKIFLANFGYKVTEFNDIFNEEMLYLTRVFNRRFNQDAFQINSDIWYVNSQLILEGLNPNPSL